MLLFEITFDYKYDKKKINKILYVFLFVSYEKEVTRNNTNFLCMKQFVIYMINVSYKIEYCGLISELILIQNLNFFSKCLLYLNADNGKIIL